MEGEQVQASANTGNLSAAEWSAYVADQKYVHTLVKPGFRARLNLADPRQYAFSMARLKMSGKNAANSPYLFQRIEERRQQHISAGYKVGQLSADNRAFVSEGRSEQHELSATGTAGGATLGAASAAPLKGGALSTFPDGSLYTWLDVSYQTTSGYPIAPYEYKEEFERSDGFVGADVTVSTIANPNLSVVKRWIVSSYKYEDSGADFVDSYRYTEVGAENPLGLGAEVVMGSARVDEPIDHTGDGLISLCVHREWTHDCDRVLDGPNGWWDIQLPLQGKISVLSPHLFSQRKIDEIINTLSQNVDHPDAGSLTIILSRKGGGCTVFDSTETLAGKMLAFWKTVKLEDGERTFKWNLTGEEVGVFSQACAMHDDAKITAFIPVTLLDAADPTNVLKEQQTSFTVSTDVRELPADQRGKIGPVKITNSCLAAGTQIRTKGGKLVPIESLQAGQEIFNPYDSSDRLLTVMDTAKGIEPTPMVRLRDEAGRTLLLTERHPVSTPDRGMVQARMLRTGDVVLTQAGPSKLVDVGREAYSGKVYNLKVGTEAEMAKLGPDQTIVYANGFVVGDGQIQSKYEDLAAKQEYQSPAAQMPSQWRQDYLLSTQRQRQ